MLTARAEQRLRLRADNAATRLGALARSSGALGGNRSRWLAVREKRLHQARELVGEGRTDEACALGEVGREAIEDMRYAPYVDRQRRELDRVRAEGAHDLTRIESFRSIPGLSQEMVERLDAARPTTLADAGRIRGVTPAALVAVLLASRRRMVG